MAGHRGWNPAEGEFVTLPHSPGNRDGTAGRGANLVCRSTPGAAVAALPCPGLPSVALSGQKSGWRKGFQPLAVSSRKDVGHVQLSGERENQRGAFS